MSKEYYPPMHTAEHILNQTMVRKFNCGRSYSNHIEKRKSKCDYIFNKNLSELEIIEIEKTVNEIISMNLKVQENMIPIDEARIKFNLDNLPESVVDEVRVIKIGDYDSCLCIGQHVSNTSEIGLFKILSSTFENNRLRIRFKIIE